MSAKHIAAVKEAEKKNKGGSKGNNNSRAAQQQKNQSTERTAEKEGQDDPLEVTNALSSFRKVTKVIQENPGMAASVMWKITKGNIELVLVLRILGAFVLFFFLASLNNQYLLLNGF